MMTKLANVVSEVDMSTAIFSLFNLKKKNIHL